MTGPEPINYESKTAVPPILRVWGLSRRVWLLIAGLCGSVEFTKVEVSMKRKLVLCVVGLCICTFVRADTWFFDNKLVTKPFKFGKSTIVLEVDGRKDRRRPPHTLSIHLDGALAAKYRNVGFEHLYASKDNRFIAGLSNEGIPGTAFVVFDAEGNLLREVKHEHMPYGIYTAHSVTIVRTWFESQRPVEFKVGENGRLASVLVWGTRVKRYDLLEPDLGFAEDEEERLWADEESEPKGEKGKR